MLRGVLQPGEPTSRLTGVQALWSWVSNYFARAWWYASCPFSPLTEDVDAGSCKDRISGT